jgi:hypothetical protein
MLIGTAIALSGALVAGDVRSFNSAEVKLFRRGWTEWYAGGGLRFRDGLGDAFDRRIYGGVVVDLGRGVEADFSYLFRYRESDELGLRPDRRATVSVEYPLLRSLWILSGTTSFERHFAAPVTPDFNRYRQRFEVERASSNSTPWLSSEMAFRREGFVRSRSRAGWKWTTAGGHEVSVAYQFESVKDGQAWAPRHAIVTAFEFPRLRSE